MPLDEPARVGVARFKTATRTASQNARLNLRRGWHQTPDRPQLGGVITGAPRGGVRFARRFVLIVPVGMALAGMSVGNGRSAYQTPFGQLMVVLAIGTVVACWLWAGRIMHLPEEDRVFFE